MTKLSKAQQKTFDDINRMIEKAMECETFEEYFDRHVSSYLNSRCNTVEKCEQNAPEYFELYKKQYNERKYEHLTLVQANTKTVERLEKEGLIEIVRTAERKGGCELVRLIF